MPFRNLPLAGVTLVRSSIQSNPYVAGSIGWTINRDGTAEFNGVTVRGSVVVGPVPGAHIIVDSVSDAVLVYDASNSLIGSISPKNQTIGGVAVSAGFQVFRPTDHNIFARMFDDQVEFHDTTTIPTSTPGSISNANVTTSGGTTFLRLYSGVTGSKADSDLVCVGESGAGTFPAYLGGVQQLAAGGASLQGQILQNDRLAHQAPAFVRFVPSTNFTSDAGGNVTYTHGLGFTPTGSIFQIQTRGSTAFLVFTSYNSTTASGYMFSSSSGGNLGSLTLAFQGVFFG